MRISRLFVWLTFLQMSQVHSVCVGATTLLDENDEAKERARQWDLLCYRLDCTLLALFITVELILMLVYTV